MLLLWVLPHVLAAIIKGASVVSSGAALSVDPVDYSEKLPLCRALPQTKSANCKGRRRCKRDKNDGDIDSFAFATKSKSVAGG